MRKEDTELTCCTAPWTSARLETRTVLCCRTSTWCLILLYTSRLAASLQNGLKAWKKSITFLFWKPFLIKFHLNLFIWLPSPRLLFCAFVLQLYLILQEATPRCWHAVNFLEHNTCIHFLTICSGAQRWCQIAAYHWNRRFWLHYSGASTEVKFHIEISRKTFVGHGICTCAVFLWGRQKIFDRWSEETFLVSLPSYMNHVSGMWPNYIVSHTLPWTEMCRSSTALHPSTEMTGLLRDSSVCAEPNHRNGPSVTIKTTSLLQRPHSPLPRQRFQQSLTDPGG